MIETLTDIVDRIEAYDAGDGRHCDRAGGSAYDLLSDAKAEIEALRLAITDERERCAAIAEHASLALSPGPLYHAGFAAARQFIAERIRAASR